MISCFALFSTFCRHAHNPRAHAHVLMYNCEAPATNRSVVTPPRMFSLRVFVCLISGIGYIRTDWSAQQTCRGNKDGAPLASSAARAVDTAKACAYQEDIPLRRQCLNNIRMKMPILSLSLASSSSRAGRT